MVTPHSVNMLHHGRCSNSLRHDHLVRRTQHRQHSFEVSLNEGSHFPREIFLHFLHTVDQHSVESIFHLFEKTLHCLTLARNPISCLPKMS